MAREFFSRAERLFPSSNMMRGHAELVGVGAVGGWAAQLLAKMGAGRLTVWDGDTVGTENIGPQPYFPDEIGQPKVRALAARVHAMTGGATAVMQRAEKWEPGMRLSGAPIVISAADSMDVRAALFKDAWLDDRVQLFLDCRMGAEELEVYAVPIGNLPARGNYERTLYKQGDAPSIPCTEKATSFCGAIAGGILARMAAVYMARGEFPPQYVTVDLKAYYMERIIA